jgi:hypothetical protein
MFKYRPDSLQYLKLWRRYVNGQEIVGWQHNSYDIWGSFYSKITYRVPSLKFGREKGLILPNISHSLTHLRCYVLTGWYKGLHATNLGIILVSLLWSFWYHASSTSCENNTPSDLHTRDLSASTFSICLLRYFYWSVKELERSVARRDLDYASISDASAVACIATPSVMTSQHSTSALHHSKSTTSGAAWSRWCANPPRSQAWQLLTWP